MRGELSFANWLSQAEALDSFNPLYSDTLDFNTLAPEINSSVDFPCARSIETQLTAIGIGFLIGLPLLLAGVGGVMWWRRRRA